MINDMVKILRSMRIALHGLRQAYSSDKSFRMEVNYGIPVYFALGYLLSPFQSWEWLVFIFSYLLILIMELMNTAIETVLERLHPERHELIGAAKDIASAAVFLAFIFAFIVVCTLAYERIV